MNPMADISENEFYERHPEALKELLKDRSTGKNIIWATGSYSSIGEGFSFYDTIEPEKITGKNGLVIMPRAVKSRDEQARRVRNMAEVFTPSWLCNRMNNCLDEEWFGRKDVFNTIDDNHKWHPQPKHIDLPADKSWQDYAQATRLEITCGEAPFLVSRYDTVTGEAIALDRRIGILDRKLRMVGENAADEEEWTRWALIALGSCYGYEWQGDSLLLAREAVLETFVEYYERHFQQPISGKLLAKAAEIVSWNLWQMDGLKGVVPGSCHEEKELIANLFGEPEVKVTSCAGCASGDITRHNGQYCQLRRWIADDKSIMPAHFDFSFLDIITKKYKTYHKTKWLMKFDFIIGNPPYQTNQNGRDLPIYDNFMDEAYKIGKVTELVTPARFLFNAGQTHSDWNKKILSDKHFKVLEYSGDSSTYFSGVDIKGGVAIHIHDNSKSYGAIGIFVPYPIMRSILYKVKSRDDFESLYKIVHTSSKYSLDNIYKDHPEYLQYIKHSGKDSQIDTNAFGKMPIFTKEPPTNEPNCIQMLGRINNHRDYYWTPERYIADPGNLFKYKVFVSAVNGSGDFGIALSNPVVGKPRIGSTQSFLGIGEFDTEEEAKNLLKYLKSKFARALLCTLKITHHNNPDTWANIPLQDFTSSSDIDWSKSIHEIDLQLYDKYGLTDAERDFIETHVKPME